MDSNRLVSKTEDKKKWYNRILFTRYLAWLYVALVTAYYDVKNFIKFRKEIMGLKSDPNSLFNKMGLKVNTIGNVVYTQKIMDYNRVIGLNDRQKNLYLIDATQLEHDYLFDKLLWGEYLITEFIDFSDEDGNMSGYYGVTFTFTPMAVNNPKLYWVFLIYLVIFSFLIWISRHQILKFILWIVSLM